MMKRTAAMVLGALVVLVAMNGAADAANINWDFWHDGAGDLNGWTVLHGVAHLRAGDGEGMTPGTGAGPGTGGGFAHDGAHETLLVESPAFTFYGDGGTLDGTHAMQWKTSGGAGNQGGSTTATPTNPAQVLAFNSGNSHADGQKGLAFLNTSSGQYDAVLHNQGDGGDDTNNLTTTDLTAAGVNVAQEYKLHYYEHDQGGWGWGLLNSVQIATSPDPPPSLVGYWTFNNDSTAGPFTNEIDTKFNGTAVGGGTVTVGTDVPTQLAGGKSVSMSGDGAIRIDGSSSTQTGSGDHDGRYDNQLSTSMAISTWFKGLPDGTWDAIVSKKGEDSHGYQLRRHGSSQDLGTTIRGTSAADDIQGPNVNDGQWHHAVMTWDGTWRQLWVDGDQKYSVHDMGTMPSPTNEFLVLGARDNPAGTLGGFANVQMDDTAIFNEGLAPNQIAYLANGGDPRLLPAGPPPPAPPKLLGRGGPGGTYSAYELDPTARTWDEARVNAADSTFGNAQGHLITIGNAEENTLLQRHVGSGDRWIGMTDSTHTSSLDGTNLAGLGTSEHGNTGGNPMAVGTAPTAGQRGEGFQWVTGEPVTYNYWGTTTEPNDSSNEDAAHIRGDGMWNDHNGGSTLVGGGQSDHRIASVIEYDLGIASPGHDSLPGFVIRVVKAGDGAMGGLSDVDSLIATQGAAGTLIGGPTGVAQADFYQDSGGPFGVNNPFPGRGQGSDIDNNAAVQATGTMTVSVAGNYQFRIQGDDGGRLRIDGQDIVADDAAHGFGGPTSPTVFLAAGAHSFEWVNFEIGGGWGAELTYSNGGPFVLVGDASQGIGATISAVTLKSVDAGDINNLARAEQLLAGQLQAQDGTPLIGITSVIDFLDGGGNGRFSNDFSFLGVTGDDYILEATGVVRIPQAGDWTFGTNSDDGTLLTIDGVDKVHDRTGGPEDNFRVYNFAQPGWYDLRLLFFERSGGAEVELFAAQGNFSSWGQTSDWRLVGDVDRGGLLVVTAIPEPATMALLGLAITGLAGYVRRRRRA